MKKMNSTTTANESVLLKIENLASIDGMAEWDWFQARTAYSPSEKPLWITTMSKTGRGLGHDFHDIYQTLSRDAGRNWSEPMPIPSLKRTRHSDGYESVPGDLWPTCHAKSGMVLATGITFDFADGEKQDRSREKVAYAVMDPVNAAWEPMRFLEMPERDHEGYLITSPSANCTQRVDLSDGDILLPIRYWRDNSQANYVTVVVRCGFDGETLIYKEHGSELTILDDRGFYEPSLAYFGGNFYLTLRADHSAYVARGSDGINFESVKEWTFDNGARLGSYNTQQHWVTVGGALFLVYTREGADNDHIARHRAPLFIGQVNPDTLQVIRSSERVLIPENHATLGNSGVCWVNENESWVTCAEGLLRLGKRKGQRNKVFFVKVTA